MEVKKCTQCLRILPVDQFSKRAGRPGQADGYRSKCKECTNAWHRQHYRQPKANHAKAVLSPGMKRCIKCGGVKPLASFHPECHTPTRPWHYSSYCKSCSTMQQRRFSRKLNYIRPSELTLEYKLLDSKAKNSRNNKTCCHGKWIEFALKIDDVRDLINSATVGGILRCQVTGTPLEINKPNTPLYPSIDRINNSHGYVPGNIRLTSLMYNLGRNDWTDIDSIVAIHGLLGSRSQDWEPFIRHILSRRVVTNGVYINPGSGRTYRHNLTPDDIRNTISSQMMDGQLRCALTGCRLVDIVGHPLYPSIDRIDSNTGYTPDNIRITSRFANLARNRWSDDIFKDALNKMRAANKIGDLYNICGLQVFGDELLQKADILDQLLGYKYKSNKPMSLRPSKCTIKLAESKLANEFYTKFHYIGKIDAKWHIGAFYDNKLIACMAIKRPGRQASGDWELARMASDRNYHIHGIWSYMLRWLATQKLISGKLVTFSDNRLFGGAVYQKMGFEFERDVPPTHYWVRDGIRYSKSSLRKSDQERASGYTESQLRTAQGYNRVWDIGKKKWTITLE